MEKEAEEERVRKQRAATEKAFQDGITKAKLVMRRTPLGTDRNHNRLVKFIFNSFYEMTKIKAEYKHVLLHISN